MIITEQRIKEIILEELLLEQQLLNEKKVTDYINKFRNNILDFFKKNKKNKQNPNSPINIALRNWANEYQKLLINNPNISREDAIQFNIQQAKEVGMPEEDIKNILTRNPPPSPKDEEEPESIGTEDFAPEDDSTNKSEHLYDKISSKTSFSKDDIEKTIKILIKNNLLKPEIIKKYNLSENSKFRGKYNMSINKKVLKRIIKEEMQKARTNEAFEGIMGDIQGIKAGLKSARSGEMSGGKTGRLPNLMKKSLADIAAQTKKLSLQITDIKKQADASNLQVSKELQTVIGAISRANEESTKLSTSNQQLLFPKGSPEAASGKSPDAGGTNAPGGQTTGAGPVVGPISGPTTAGDSAQQVGGGGVGDISPADYKAETEKIRTGGGMTADVSTKMNQANVNTTTQPQAQQASTISPQQTPSSSQQAQQKPAPVKLSASGRSGIMPYYNVISKSEGYPENISGKEFAAIISALGGESILSEQIDMAKISAASNVSPEKVKQLVDFLQKNNLIKTNDQQAASAEQKQDKNIKSYTSLNKDLGSFFDQIKSELPDSISTPTALANMLKAIDDNLENILTENEQMSLYDSIAKKTKFNINDIKQTIEVLKKHNLLKPEILQKIQPAQVATTTNESLNEQLISRNKNNLSNEQIKRMKLLAGIIK